MKITNILSDFSGSLLVKRDNGWKPRNKSYRLGHSLIEKHLDPKQGYWWLPQTKKDKTPAVVEVTPDQAIELVDHGYKFEVMEDNNMKITNVKEKSGSRTTDDFLLVEDENGWKPNSNVDFIQVGLDPYKRYWWQLGKTDKTPAVLDVTIEQAKGLLDKGYSFEVMEASMVKITNIKYGNTTFIEDSDGWSPDTTNTGDTRVWGIEKYLDPAKKYWSVSVSDKSKPVVAELKIQDAIALKFEGYAFDIVKEEEEMNETEGPKFYALQDKYGLVFKLPDDFQDGFRAGKSVTRPITSKFGYIIFTDLEQAQKIADYSYSAGGFDKLQVVEVDPIAKKVIKVVGGPKPAKWRIAWSGGESTPKWFKGNAFGTWSLVTSKSEAREFDTLKSAEDVVSYIDLTGLYVTEDK